MAVTMDFQRFRIFGSPASARTLWPLCLRLTFQPGQWRRIVVGVWRRSLLRAVCWGSQYSNIYSDPNGSKKPRYDPPARRNVTAFSRSPAAVRSALTSSQAVSVARDVGWQIANSCNFRRNRNRADLYKVHSRILNPLRRRWASDNMTRSILRSQ
jgi:hypothetical protein